MGSSGRCSRSLATVVISFGWASRAGGALMAMRGASRFDGKIGPHHGVPAGFVVAALAPARSACLPELPGCHGGGAWCPANLVAAHGFNHMTGAGLWCLAYWQRRRYLLRVAGLVLVALPHLLGAPQAGRRLGGTAPPELAAQFATASLDHGIGLLAHSRLGGRLRAWAA